MSHLRKKNKKTFVVVERFNLTEWDEDYKGQLIKKIFKDKLSALKYAKKLRKEAKEGTQDYKYEVEEVDM